MVWTDPDDFPGANRQRDGRYGFEPSRPGGKNYVGDLSTNRSKVLWEITLNDGDHDENAGFYWSDTPDPVNEEALRLWRRLGDALATRSGARKRQILASRTAALL